MNKLKFYILSCGFAFCILNFMFISFAQETKPATEPQPEAKALQEAPQAPTVVIPKPDFELNLDINSKTIPLPKIFSPSIDLSGRGFHKEETWPYHFAAKGAIERWRKDIGFNKGIFRMHWNLWETHPGKKINKSVQEKIIANYETVIKDISDAGGTVLLCLYGMPPGFGRVLDKRSPPANFKQWKILVKNTVRYLSYEKKYNIWYEVWDTPDSDNFFLGEKKDYLNLYRFTAEAIKELKREKKINIPLGGPSVSWWFQNLDSNSILTPEKSLIYELIKFCRNYKLPLDFISWHAYSTDPFVEKESTTYNQAVTQLIRQWLTFFHFDKNTPLIIDEWNYDPGNNMSEERQDKSYIAASYILPRLRSMYEVGIDYQNFFSLEDFQNNKERIDNNRGILSYNPESSIYHSQAKSIYNLFLMLNNLGDNFYSAVNINDEFINLLATKRQEDIIILIGNYIDPYIERSFLSKNIASLNEKERMNLLSIIKEEKLNKLINKELSVDSLSVTDKLKGLLKKTLEIKSRSLELLNKPINIKITLSNIKGNYLYQRYSLDSNCAWDCPFSPVEEKELNIDNTYQQMLTINPYSVHLVILKKKIGQGG